MLERLDADSKSVHLELRRCRQQRNRDYSEIHGKFEELTRFACCQEPGNDVLCENIGCDTIVQSKCKQPDARAKKQICTSPAMDENFVLANAGNARIDLAVSNVS